MIKAKHGPGLMQVVNQYRDQEQNITKWRNLDLQALIEQTLTQFDTGSQLKGEDPIQSS